MNNVNKLVAAHKDILGAWKHDNAPHAKDRNNMDVNEYMMASYDAQPESFNLLFETSVDLITAEQELERREVVAGLLGIDINKGVSCSWCGRHGTDVSVVGAVSKEEARKHALHFFHNDENGIDVGEGITLDDGCSMTWTYEEPQPEDWQDHYIFHSCDEHPVDQREWWEK